MGMPFKGRYDRFRKLQKERMGGRLDDRAPCDKKSEFLSKERNSLFDAFRRPSQALPKALRLFHGLIA